MSRHSWFVPFALLAVTLVAVILGQVVVLAQAPSKTQTSGTALDAIHAAMSYIADHQLEDGGIDAFLGGGSDPSGTARTILAWAATGHDPEALRHVDTSKTMVDYLSSVAISYTHQTTYTDSAHLFPGNAGLVLAAVAAANQDGHNFGGMDLITQLQETYIEASGAYSTTATEGWDSGLASPVNQAWAIIGLIGAGESVPITATQYLIEQQETTGAWTFGDPDITALCVTALIASGHIDPTAEPVQSALQFLRDTQLDSGGWRPWWDSDLLNADSTGWVLQALVASGYVPPTVSWANPTSPVDALLGMQQPDGSIGGTYVNPFSTSEALIGLGQQPVYMLGHRVRALRALTALHDAQHADGGWDMSPSDGGQTCDAILAYAVAGIDPNTVLTPGSGISPLDYLQGVTDEMAHSSADKAGKLAVAIAAAGEDPHNFAGIDVVRVLTETHYSDATGTFGDPNDTWQQAWPILGLAAAGETIPFSATQNLLDLQQPDGSWIDAWGFSAPDTTGLVLQALIAGGIAPEHTAIQDALAYLESVQAEDGGWENANATAYVIQGLLATGEDLSDWGTPEGRTPLQALADYQKVDGPFVWMWESPWPGLLPTDNEMATRQAVPALLGEALPIHPAAFVPFERVNTGPDPDRLLFDEPQAELGHSIDITLPIGSDLDQDAQVQIQWRKIGEPNWHDDVDEIRRDGYYSAEIPTDEIAPYQFWISVSDSDGVQRGDITGQEIEFYWRPQVYELTYLPWISR